MLIFSLKRLLFFSKIVKISHFVLVLFLRENFENKNLNYGLIYEFKIFNLKL
jgi:hypothetical protein